MLRCVYTDLDGTLLGWRGSLFRDADGGFSLLQARALEACHRAGVEVVIKSGRREAQVLEDARLIGQTAYIYEAGCGLMIDGEHTWLTGDLVPDERGTIYEKIEASGAPRLLLETFAGRLEYHTPWHTNREISHLFRGDVDSAQAERLLIDNGHGNLRLVDNGVLSRSMEGVENPHAYHLIPREASKAKAVAAHMRARGYDPASCIAIGDSREDLDVAPVVGRFFLVANAVERDPDITAAATKAGNVEITEGRNGEGFYEAIVRSLAEGR
jgi:hydroxymethylpyrimidine pyrophosphatase-like HAD family hydrolase